MIAVTEETVEILIMDFKLKDLATKVFTYHLLPLCIIFY